jgi:hypothetical protein
MIPQQSSRMKFRFAMPFLFALAAYAEAPKALQADGVENVFSLTPRIVSGSAPESEAGFAALQKLGVKTIVSVDGAPPNADLARKFGMRTIHLPIGYDGVSASKQVQLVKAAQSVEGAIYIHCHHGKHRGPAAAAVICEGIAQWTPAQATDWLKSAGTAPDYAGLYKAVREFKMPTAEQLRAVPADFPERARVSAQADAMVQLDEHFEFLKLLQKSAWKAPAAHPDLVAKNEALLIRETFRELLRRDDSKAKGADFLASLEASETLAAKLQQSLTDADTAKADTALRDLTQQCVQCHKQFRN